MLSSAVGYSKRSPQQAGLAKLSDLNCRLGETAGQVDEFVAELGDGNYSPESCRDAASR